MTYDRQTALVVVDVQNDFADPAGSLSVPRGDAVVAVANREVAAAKQAGALVVYTQDWHPERTPHFMADGGPWPMHCVHGSWGAALHPDLSTGAIIVRKGTGGEDGYSGFTMVASGGAAKSTGLHELLRRKHVTKVRIVGLATDYCVLATAIDAVNLGYETVVLLDGVKAVDVTPGDGTRALDRMVAAGVNLV
ncbi:MAG: isochorismatase family protein [Acidimicrobiia bacterium]